MNQPISQPLPAIGQRLHRFTVAEYLRIAELGILAEDDPVELIEGCLVLKIDHGPPYGVPHGIPPAILTAGMLHPPDAPLRKLTVTEYGQMVDQDIFDPTLRHELIEGWVVDKMTRGTRHDSTIQRITDLFYGLGLGPKWRLRCQLAITCDDSVLEPDFAIVPGPVDRFTHQHPLPYEIEVVIEVSDSTLALDRGMKRRDYARNGLRVYWIVDLIHDRIEVCTNPSGPTDSPVYADCSVIERGHVIEIELGDEQTVSIAVEDILPPA